MERYEEGMTEGSEVGVNDGVFSVRDARSDGIEAGEARRYRGVISWELSEARSASFSPSCSRTRRYAEDSNEAVMRPGVKP